MRNETARREIESLDYYLQNHTNDYSEESHTAMMMAVDALSSKWIPISEKLPEDGTWNLFTNGRNVSVERYKADALDHFYPNGRWFSLDEVTAWMPLPQPYEPQESEEQT